MNILALVTPSSELQSSLCSDSWNISFPSFTDLGVCSNVSLIFPHFLVPDRVFLLQVVFFTLKHIATSLVAGLSCALRWVVWREMEPAVPSMGQPQLLLTEVTLQSPLTVLGDLHPILTYIILETHIQYIYKMRNKKEVSNKKYQVKKVVKYEYLAK